MKKERLLSHLLQGKASDVDDISSASPVYGTILLQVTDVYVNRKLTCRALKFTSAQQIATLTETDPNDPCSDSVCSEIPLVL